MRGEKIHIAVLLLLPNEGAISLPRFLRRVIVHTYGLCYNYAIKIVLLYCYSKFLWKKTDI